jgi:hypothetical protein
MQFLPLPEVEIEFEGSSFRDDGKHTKNVTYDLHTLMENDFWYCYDQ